ncbi:hypothetical protein [uncultured Tateyamaria sp.]|uniref:hypothetical protein n=1 Tax=uncultured Tateyamaria sp. TaxID=455651 RepID=UPI00260A000C|nr:hypothetical protein [uncultured Tateyamaria sp.]
MLSYILLLVFVSFGMSRVQRFIGGHLGGERDIRKGESLIFRLIKAGIETFSPVGNPEDNIATIFSVGRSLPQQEGDAIVFRATAGWRYGYLALMPFVIGFAIYLELSSGLSGQTPLDMYLLIAGMLVWCGVYMWKFRLVVDGVDMTCTSGLLMQRRFDLSRMTSAKNTRDGYKLYFDDGRRIGIPRFLEGHDLLKAFLIEQLEDNGY